MLAARCCWWTSKTSSDSLIQLFASRLCVHFVELAFMLKLEFVGDTNLIYTIGVLKIRCDIKGGCHG